MGAQLDLLIVYLSFKLLARPRFSIKRRGEGFSTGLCKNIKALGLDEETTLRLQAAAIAASSRGLKERRRICDTAFDILDEIVEGE